MTTCTHCILKVHMFKGFLFLVMLLRKNPVND